MNMMFYEIEHDIGMNHFRYMKKTNMSFPLHMHRCYEMMLMLDGEMTIQIDNIKYSLKTGDLILVKPYLIHSYETEAGKNGTCLLCVFSDDLIAAISGPISKYKLDSILLHDIPTVYRDIFIHMQGKSDIASIKGLLYVLCSLFYLKIDYTEEDTFSGSSQLLRDIFIYIENNIGNSCNLHDLAKELRYNEFYLSRMFLKHVGITYTEYVRNTKMNHACYLLRNTDDGIFSIASKCGYATHSSFNRCFKQFIGMTPQEYRIQNCANNNRVTE